MIKEAKQRLSDIDRQLMSYEARREMRLSDLKRKKGELHEMIETLRVVQMAEEVLSKLSIMMADEEVKVVDDLVTKGLKAVFHDMNLEFKCVVDRSRGRTSVRFVLLEDGKKRDLMSACGGGVVAIVGLLLRVVMIVVFKVRRVLILDETLAHVSKEYQGSASELLRNLCSELGFVIVMVSHQDEFASQADVRYEVSGILNGASKYRKVE